MNNPANWTDDKDYPLDQMSGRTYVYAIYVSGQAHRSAATNHQIIVPMGIIQYARTLHIPYHQ